MNIKKTKTYMEIATSISNLSYAERRKVGALLVDSGGRMVGEGYNGTPSGTDNSCELNNITKEEVIHAEVNAILNAHKKDLSDCTIYITLSPCVRCASMLIQKKIKTVIYKEKYRDLSGVEYLESNGVKVICIDDII